MIDMSNFIGKQTKMFEEGKLSKKLKPLPDKIYYTRVIKDLGTKKAYDRFLVAECQFCNSLYEVRRDTLWAKPNVSCGCKKGNNKHGLCNHPLYTVWLRMKQRCYDKSDPLYRFYGERGVTVCEEWRQNFTAFYDWAMANGWKYGLQIDKDILCDRLGISPKIYSPETCHFISKKENVVYSTLKVNTKEEKI